jgi:signal transduction histidine kinase
MIDSRHKTSLPLKLLVLFLLLSTIPLGALGWLGWRMLGYERELEVQRQQQRLNDAASVLARELDRALSEWEKLLAAATEDSRGQVLVDAIPQDSVLLIFDGNVLINRHGVRLPYYPLAARVSELQPDVFAAGEKLEIREGKLGEAATAYERLTHSTDAHVRAAALVRFARVLRQQGDIARALVVYDELSGLAATPAPRDPAELVARRERKSLLQQSGDKGAAQREMQMLHAALLEGRYSLDRPTFDLYWESVTSIGAPAQYFTFAEVVETLWSSWQEQAPGRRSWNHGDGRFVSVWKRDRDKRHAAAIVAPLKSLIGSARDLAADLKVRLELKDSEPGERTAGEAIKTARETGLPWAVRVTSADAASLIDVAASRRKLLSAAFALIVLVIGAAGYIVYRAINRELSVARLQSDFVSAVSHEFRSPLTAMSHLTEMLEEGSVPSQRLHPYYSALRKETRRLQDLIESLLDFGRIEAGRRAYHLQDTDMASLAATVVQDFRGHVSDDTGRLKLIASCNGAVQIRADREALTVALRNLIDNAMKYSPESSPVTVSLECSEGLAGVSVTDRGAGIPKQEQQQIFRKFVRGTSARSLNIKGTGIGLALASSIVHAHGGRLELKSEPGKGSRFTIWLPVQAERS